MSQDAGCAERFLCALFATVVKPISDLRLLISGLCAVFLALCLPAQRAAGEESLANRCSLRRLRRPDRTT